jgi:tRNA A37 threonylcarbamoyladenosine synthetase subunit TsaC/SUA5/YrdC
LQNNCTYLAQSDTTVGIFSKDYKKLNKLKKRNEDKPCLISVSSLDKLTSLTRVPLRYKKYIRRAKQKTFLYPDKKAIRVSFNARHNLFLDRFDFLYSTSANLHKQKFNYNDISILVDEIINDTAFSENTPSTIYKINNHTIKRIR